MEHLKVENGKITAPQEFELTKEKRRLTMKTAWSSRVDTLNNEGIITTQMWFRSKKSGDKPYIPEGFIELDGKRFVVDEELK